MQFVGRVFSSVSDFYTGINPSTLSGAVDIIVVEDEETKVLTSSPFHVRFGKFQVLRPQDRVVELEVNGRPCEQVKMKVGEAGEAFFVEEMEDDGGTDQDLLTSPLPQPMGQAVPVGEMEKLSLIKSDDEHANALSDSELDVIASNREEEPIQRSQSSFALSGAKDATPASSPPRYFWNWGSLPTKKEKDTESAKETSKEKIACEKEAANMETTRERSQSPMSRGLADVLPALTLSEWLAKQDAIEVLSTKVPSQIYLVTVKQDSDLHLGDWRERLEAEMSNLDASDWLQTVPMDLALADDGAFLRKDECIYAIKMDDDKLIWVTGKLGWTVWMAWKFGKPPTKEQLATVAVKEPAEPAKPSSWWWRGKKIGKEKEGVDRVSADRGSVDRASVDRGSVEGSNDKEKTASNQTASNHTASNEVDPPATTSKKYRKSLRLTSEQLQSLGLNPGLNTIAFNIPSTSAKCQARIFLWPSSASIVVSDIDGTITKSDALGHLFTMVGRDWTHVGVARLYTEMARNGYRLMYLTSRAIGQAQSTRTYLKGVEQDKYQLPDGPVIMSPDRFFAAVRRELIEGNPESFKIAALMDVARLFGGLPFYAGFGNRYNDALAYRAVGIPASRIFTINPSGDLSLELIGQYYSARSYERLTDLVDQLFPPLPQTGESQLPLSPASSTTSSLNRRSSILSPPRQAASDEPYNDFFYWRRGLTGVLPAKPLSPLNSSSMIETASPVLTTSMLEKSKSEVDVDEEEEELAEEEEGLIPYV